MFGYTIKRFIVNWISTLALVAIVASFVLGYNSLANSFDPFAGFNALGDMFGGLASLGGIALVIVAAALIGLGIVYVARHDFAGKPGKLVAVVVFAMAIPFVAAIIGFDWININEDFWPTLWTIVGLVVLVTAFTAWITPRSKKIANITAVGASRPDHHTSSVA